MSVAFGSTETGVAKERLDIADICAVFKQVGGKSVAEIVNRDFFGNIGFADSFFENVLGGTD